MIQLTNIFDGATLILAALLLIVLYTQSIRKKYKIPYMILTITFTVLGNFFSAISSMQTNFGLINLFKTLFFCSISITAIFYYFFIESCSSPKANVKSLIPILIIFSICQAFGFIRLIPTLPSELYTQFTVWMLILYGVLGMIVYGGFGIRFNFHTYQMTKEKPAIILTIANIFGFITFALIPIGGYLNNGDLYSINFLSSLVYILSIIFDALFVLGYLFNLDYIYRLPDNYYSLMVYYKSGIPIFQRQIQSRKNIKIEDALVSGFLAAVNSLFGQSLSATEDIENISSKNASITIRTGKYVSVVVLGEKSTAKLFDAITHLVKLVDNKYDKELGDDMKDLNEFSGIIDLVPQCFPFFKLKPIDLKN